MATLTSITDLKSENTNTATVQLALRHTVTYSGGSYYHFITNIPNNSNRMFMIEAIGYTYGNAQAVRCAWSGYPYGPSNAVINNQVRSIYGGLTPYNAYYGNTGDANGFVCIKASTSSYFSGWIFNGYTPSPGGYGFQIRITGFTQNTDSGNFYA